MGKRNNRRRRARTETVYGSVPQSKKMWRKLLKIMGENCLKCGAGGPCARDHIVPLCRGGLHHPANLQPLCVPCNSIKNDTIMDYRTPEMRTIILQRWPLEGLPDSGDGGK